MAASASELELTNNIKHLGNKNENGNITCASLSKCHEYFAVCDDKKNVTVWQSKNWKEFYKQWSLPTKAYSVCFSNDSDRLLVAGKVLCFMKYQCGGCPKSPDYKYIEVLIQL